MNAEGTYEIVEVLKRDLFGEVTRGLWRTGDERIDVVRRDVSRAPLWTRWIARVLARRERRALEHLRGLGGVPQLIEQRRRTWVVRRWIPGIPLQRAPVQEPAFFACARRRLVQLHRRGVAHNDLAKEPNLLVTDAGEPAFVDFQLATVHRRRSRFFRMLAREDLRHLVKHLRHYHPNALTLRQRRMVATRSCPARWWRLLGKPVYLFVTRKLFHWSDREGAGDRGSGGRALREGSQRPRRSEGEP
ncbi:MAG: serine/threonine protein kinase [Planctomycetes bacterium]|nr:serine/threonine protein kinase [Planctomycetota bacterium]